MTTTLERPAAPTAPAVPARARPRGWERPTLLALLAATAVLYLWGLGESGWANSFGGPGGGFRGGAADGQVTQGGTAAGGLGGGLLNGSTAGSEMVALLQADADDYTWAAATVGSNNASGYQLATGQPVMAIGGFNGTDPSPTLAQFQQYVAAGKIHYFIAGGTGGGTRTGGSVAAQEIANWVAQNFTATTVGGVTVYDLTS